MFEVKFSEKYDVKVEFMTKDNLPKQLSPLVENEVFSAKLGEIHNGLSNDNKGTIYLGLSAESLDLEEVKGLGFKLGNLLNSRKISDAEVDLALLNNEANVVKLFFEGLANSQYRFDYYKVNKKPQTLLNVSFNNVDESLINEAVNVVAGINYARDFVNLTPIDLYPESYANKLVELFKNTKVKVTVYNKEQIEALGMHALLAVNKGSDNEPRFVVLEYFNNDATLEHVTLVGKGVTYDSGGYAIKSAGGMASMKSDMGGSAAVAGAIYAVAKNELKANVVGVMSLTDNLISGTAYKNGDVINSMKGTTIEVINTDAEGRLTLADSIYYAATKLKSTKIIEASTLTGAVIVALGKDIVGVVTKDDELYEEIHKIGIETDEFNWRLPMTKGLINSVKSDIAELKNSVAGGAGTITAGIFLDHFAEDKPFLHLDIAGAAYGTSNKYAPNGATGVGIKTLYEFVKKQ